MLVRVLLALMLSAGAASAQTTAGTPAQAPAPVRIPTPGGEVVIVGPHQQRAYDGYKFAPARRAGDTLYISGVIAGPRPSEGTGPEALKAGVRRAFQEIERTLKASGASFADVTMINSFHVWSSPHFSGTRDEHFAAFSVVKDEFMTAPHPAWTAVGTTGLLADTGLVEIQIIAHLPASRPR